MKQHFQLDDSIVHLNHAAVGPWPIVTHKTIIAFSEENTHTGSQRYDKWLETVQQLRHKLALLINAESIDEIAILKNTSEGLSMIAMGIDFQPGDNIVIPAEEFPSNKVVWQARATDGIELRCIPIENSDNPEQALIDAMDENTRLLSCSSVQYARGLRLDLDRLGQACRKYNSLFCVDAIQSLGAIRFDVQSCGADFVVADGHKWLCAPEGTALFYCRRPIQEKLKLSQYGWHMLKDPFEFSKAGSEIQVANSARRFESGSPNMLGIAALNASLGMLLDIGMDNIEEAVLKNSDYLFQRLSAMTDVTIRSSSKPGQYAGIINFIKPSVDNLQLYQHLQSNNVICAHRGDGIRFSPHFYIEHQRIERALALVERYTGS